MYLLPSARWQRVKRSCLSCRCPWEQLSRSPSSRALGLEERREQPGPSTELPGSEQEIGPGPWVTSFDNLPQLASGSSGFLRHCPTSFRDHTFFQGVEPFAKGTLLWGLNEQMWLLVRVCNLACQQAGAVSADSWLPLISTSPLPRGNL